MPVDGNPVVVVRGIGGYNVQTPVDTQHHMIVAMKSTNIGHDRTQLATMATAAARGDRHHEMTASRPTAAIQG